MADKDEKKLPVEATPLNEDEKKALEELKAAFPGETLDEILLVRFVRGYWTEEDRHNHTVGKLKLTLEWRKKVGADEVFYADPLPKEELFYETWPMDFHGYDKLGHPIYYENTSHLEPGKLLDNFKDEEIEKFHAHMQETLLHWKKQISRKRGHMVYKSIVIMDMGEFGMKHLSKSFYEPIKKIITIDQYYYPETLQKLFVINAPFAFRAMWAIVKPWLHPITASRIEICGGDYLTKLKELIDEDQIPKYLGGKCSCCSEKPLHTQIKSKLEVFHKRRDEIIAEEKALGLVPEITPKE